MPNQTFSEILSVFLKEIEQVKKDYEFAYMEQDRCDKLIQDYLHKLEFQKLSYHEYARIGRALQECRIARRTAKDTIARYTPVADLFATEKGKASIGQFQQLLGALRKTEKQLSNRMYTPRALSEEEFQRVC